MSKVDNNRTTDRSVELAEPLVTAYRDYVVVKYGKCPSDLELYLFLELIEERTEMLYGF